MTEFRSGRTPPGDLPELMDAPDCDRGQLTDALDVLGQSGRYFGGDRLLRRHVRRLLRGRSPGPVSILDVGAGGGASVVALDAALRTNGWQPSFVLTDLHAVTLELCRQRVRSNGGAAAAGAAFVRLDGAALPFLDSSLDLVISTTTLHHLEDGAAGALLVEFHRVARIGWVVTDLRRSRLSSAAVRLLAATAWRRHAFPRVDGPTSVRRSFTASEVRRLVRVAGIGTAVVEPRLVRWAARAPARPS